MDFQRIDSLPPEVILYILSFLDINDVIAICRQVDVEKQPTLLSRLSQYIANSKVCYTNRINNYTYLVMYLLTGSFLPKRYLDLVTTRALLIDLLKFSDTISNSLTNEITLSFYVWDSSDLLDLREIILEIGLDYPNARFTFNIEIEFDPSILVIVDLAFILDRLVENGFSTRVTSLVVTNYISMCGVDFGLFPNIQRVWLVNSNLVPVTDSHVSINRMTDIHICPNPYGIMNNLSIVLRYGLPLGLKELTLSHVTITHESLEYEYPQNLVKLTMIAIKDLTGGKFITELVEKNTVSKNLKLLEIQKLKIFPDYNKSLYLAIRNYSANLDHLAVIDHSFENATDTETRLYFFVNLKTLQIGRTVKTTNFNEIFRQLLLLNLNNCRIKNITQLQFPPTLKELYLSYNPLQWTGKVIFPPRLTKVELRHTGLTSLDHLIFPDTLTTLGLEVNQILSIDGYRFPRRLKSLGLGCNKLTSINGHYFPKSLGILHLTENLINSPIDFKRNADGEELGFFAVYMNRNNIRLLDGFKFCDLLLTLNFDENKIQVLENHLFNNLIELSCYGCQISRIRNFSFGNKLKVLNLGNNLLGSLPSDIPPTLEIFNVAYNKIRNVPFDYFKDYSCVPRINLSNNKITKIHIMPHANVKTINVSNNRIVSFRLEYDKKAIQEESTRLMILNLAGNRLTSLTPGDLGLVDPVKHNLLYEIDLTLNKVPPQNLTLEGLPELKALFVSKSGYQDAFGYDISTNMVPQQMTSGKRIDN